MVIAVCVKQVPDTTEVRIDPETNTLIREGVPSILNPEDAHAAEAAVRLKEQYGGTVVAITMGPPQATAVLQRCIALGADRGILISDRAFAGADTYATSYTLAAAIQRLAQEAPVDVVLCGRQAIDGDTAQVGPGIAQRLGFTQLTYVVGIDGVDADGRTIGVARRLENGVEAVAAPLPALLTCMEALNAVRYAGMPGMIRAARFEPEVWTRGDLDVEDRFLGLDGSPTAVSSIFAPPRRPPGEMIAGPEDRPEVAAGGLIDAIMTHAQRLGGGGGGA